MTGLALPDYLITATVHVVAAQIRGPAIAPGDLPGFIRDVHGAFAALAEPTASAPAREPAVPIRSSVKPNYIVCLEDGKKLKMLKRHLKVAFGLAPDEYRARWGLPADYPMVAPSYSAARRQLALDIGLGHMRARA